MPIHFGAIKRIIITDPSGRHLDTLRSDAQLMLLQMANPASLGGSKDYPGRNELLHMPRMVSDLWDPHQGKGSKPSAEEIRVAFDTYTADETESIPLANILFVDEPGKNDGSIMQRQLENLQAQGFSNFDICMKLYGAACKEKLKTLFFRIRDEIQGDIAIPLVGGYQLRTPSVQYDIHEGSLNGPIIGEFMMTDARLLPGIIDSAQTILNQMAPVVNRALAPTPTPAPQSATPTPPTQESPTPAPTAAPQSATPIPPTQESPAPAPEKPTQNGPQVVYATQDLPDLTTTQAGGLWRKPSQGDALKN